MTIEDVKRAIGTKAAELIQDDMIVGLGTGSTAFYFIDHLIARCRDGLKIKAVASSEKSLEQARKGGIPIIDINHIHKIDITVDGADEIDPDKRMIKGGGGALLREKIVASMSDEMIVIIDENKQVPHLGRGKLPVEILPFGFSATIDRITRLNYKGALRKKTDGSNYITDNGNYIYDISFDTPLKNPEQDNDRIVNITGVIDTGFFFGLAGRVIIGFSDGQIVEIE